MRKCNVKSVKEEAKKLHTEIEAAEKESIESARNYKRNAKKPVKKAKKKNDFFSTSTNGLEFA